MHRRLHVVAVFRFDVGTLPFLATAFLACCALELIVGEPQELFDVDSGQESLAVRNDLQPDGVVQSAFGKQKVQRRRIALAGEPRPLPERVQSDVHIIRSVAAVIAGRRPDVVRQRFQSQNQFRGLDVDPVDVQIVGAVNFGSMQL